MSLSREAYEQGYFRRVLSGLAAATLGRGFQVESARLVRADSTTTVEVGIRSSTTNARYHVHRKFWPDESGPSVTAAFAADTYVVAVEEWTAAADSHFPPTSTDDPATVLV